MNQKRKFWLGLVLAAGIVRPAWGQVPAIPAAAPVAPVAVAAPTVPAPMPSGFLGNLITTCNYCKAKFCESQLGLLMSNSLRPVSVFTGGIVGPLCPPDGVNPFDLAKPPDSVAGAAARIKADQAGAAARRAAVRYLAHADCHYWPEATAALVGALRADRNECVRWEAALALQTGCCCNPKTILALSITVSGSEEDGNPSETSDRVRAAAADALSSCLSRVPVAPFEVIPETGSGKEGSGKEGGDKPETHGSNGVPPAGGSNTVTPAAYYQNVESMSNAVVIRKARRALEQNKLRTAEASAPRASSLASQGLVAVALNAINSTPSSPAPGTVENAGNSQTPPPPAPSHPRPTEEVKDRQPILTPVPAPAIQPAVLKTPPQGPALPTLPSPSPALAPINRQFSSPPPPVPAAPRPPQVSRPAPSGPTVADLMSVLEHGTLAADRGWAAGQLEQADWHANPQVVISLVKGARADTEPSVRIACVSSLERLNVNTPEAVTTMHTVAAVDGDARVRDAALHALARLQQVQPGTRGNGTQH